MRNQFLKIAPLLALMGPVLQAADSVTLKFPTGLPAQLAPLRPGTVLDLEAEVVNPGADETLVWGAWEGSQEDDLADTLLRPLEGGRVRFVAPEAGSGVRSFRIAARCGKAFSQPLVFTVGATALLGSWGRVNKAGPDGQPMTHRIRGSAEPLVPARPREGWQELESARKRTKGDAVASFEAGDAADRAHGGPPGVETGATAGPGVAHDLEGVVSAPVEPTLNRLPLEAKRLIAHYAGPHKPRAIDQKSRLFARLETRALTLQDERTDDLKDRLTDERLIRLILDHPNVRRIKLRSTPYLTAQGLLAALNLIPNLTALSVAGNEQFDSSWLPELATSFPYLEDLHLAGYPVSDASLERYAHRLRTLQLDFRPWHPDLALTMLEHGLRGYPESGPSGSTWVNWTQQSSLQPPLRLPAIPMHPLPSLAFRTMAKLETLEILNHPILKGKDLPTGLKNLRIAKCDDFKIEHLPAGLQSLSFESDDDHVSDRLLAGIQHCPGLTYLDTDVRIKNDFLEGLPPGMTHLELFCGDLSEPNFARFPKLHTLVLTFFQKNVVTLPEGLVNLTLAECDDFEVGSLGTLPHLQSLTVNECDNWTWKTVCAALRKLPQLQTLTLRGVKGDLDLSLLKEHPTLRTALFRLPCPDQEEFIWERETQAADPEITSGPPLRH